MSVQISEILDSCLKKTLCLYSITRWYYGCATLIQLELICFLANIATVIFIPMVKTPQCKQRLPCPNEGLDALDVQRLLQCFTQPTCLVLLLCNCSSITGWRCRMFRTWNVIPYGQGYRKFFLNFILKPAITLFTLCQSVLYFIFKSHCNLIYAMCVKCVWTELV